MAFAHQPGYVLRYLEELLRTETFHSCNREPIPGYPEKTAQSEFDENHLAGVLIEFRSLPVAGNDAPFPSGSVPCRIMIDYRTILLRPFFALACILHFEFRSGQFLFSSSL